MQYKKIKKTLPHELSNIENLFLKIEKSAILKINMSLGYNLTCVSYLKKMIIVIKFKQRFDQLGGYYYYHYVKRVLVVVVVKSEKTRQ